MRHRFLIAIVLIVGISFMQSRWRLGPWAADAMGEGESSGPIETAFKNHSTGVIVTAEGKIDRILDDDTAGDRHQRFLVKLPSGATVLVTHNIDAAPRVPGVQVGAAVKVHGEYVWTEKGGTVHWTHQDHHGSHEAGWVEYDGQRYG